MTPAERRAIARQLRAEAKKDSTHWRDSTTPNARKTYLDTIPYNKCFAAPGYGMADDARLHLLLVAEAVAAGDLP